MGLEALPVSCIGSGTGWQMYCFFPFPFTPFLPPYTPLVSTSVFCDQVVIMVVFFVLLCFFFLYGTWYLDYLFWIWCSASIPGLTASFVILQFLAVSHWEYLSVLGRSKLRWAFSPMNTGIPKSLQGFLNGIIAQESKVSCSKYFMCEEFTCCQLFPKWFDVRLILDFSVSLHPHFMMHFREQKTPYYFFVSAIGQ